MKWTEGIEGTEGVGGVYARVSVSTGEGQRV